MSLYYVQKLFYHLLVDARARERFKTDCESMLADYKLAPEELRAIKSVDVTALYRMGAHPLLLRPFVGLHGIGMPEYLKAISGLEGEKKS